MLYGQAAGGSNMVSLSDQGGLVRGLALTNILSFLHERGGECAQGALLEALSCEDRAAILAASPCSWYPIPLLARSRRALLTSIGGSVVRELGRFEAERDLASPLRWSLLIAPRTSVLSRIGTLFRRHYTSGVWSSHKSADGDRAVLGDWPDGSVIRDHGTGYWGHLLSRLGLRGVAIEHPRSGPEACVITWRGGLSSGEEPLWITEDDAPHVGRELAQITSKPALAEALSEVLARVPDVGEAAVWDNPLGRGAPLAEHRRARSPDRAYEPRCFVLEARGALAGKLTLTSASAEADVLSSMLAPWIGLAAASAEEPLDPHLQRARRAAHVGARWALTPKQVEVLDQLARGRSNKEIAAQLNIAEGTVELHVSSILKKASHKSRAGLIAEVWG